MATRPTLPAVLTVVLTGCGLTDAPLPEFDATGAWRGTVPHVTITHAAASTTDPDSTVYTLRISDQNGFLHGTWTIANDTTTPTDPWSALAIGDRYEGTMAIEYHDPRVGRCQLNGPVGDSVYVAVQRCERTGWEADTLRLVRSEFERPPETWLGLLVREEGSRDGYDRDAFGSGYAKWEDEIIANLPKNAPADSVYTPYTCRLYEIRKDGTAATDIDHVVALVEAYESGLEPARFREFAADSLNLTVANPTVNRHRKSDKDPADWSPERNRGWFAAKVVAVKRKYGLGVDPAERDSLMAILAADTARAVKCP